MPACRQAGLRGFRQRDIGFALIQRAYLATTLIV